MSSMQQYFLNMEKYDWKLLISRNIRILKCVGLWPSGNDTYKWNFYTIYAALSIAIFTYGHNFFQLVNLYNLYPNLEAIVGTMFVTFSEMLTIVKTFYAVKNMGILKELMTLVNCDLFQPRNARQRHVVDSTVIYWKTCSMMLWGMSAGAIFFWSIFPVMDGSVKIHGLPFLAWYPCDTTISPNYEIIYIYQIVSTTFIASTTLSIDTIIAALNMYIGCQCDLLSDNIKHLFREAPLEHINDRLVECITHHKTILKFANDCSHFSNGIVLAQFFVSALSIGIIMFYLTVVKPFSSEFYSLISFGLAVIIEIFMYCWFGNETEIKSNKVPYAVFESDWIDAPVDVQKKIIFFMMRLQKPIKISALNLFYLSLDTFVKILRTSWSYFALLQRVTMKIK